MTEDYYFYTWTKMDTNTNINTNTKMDVFTFFAALFFYGERRVLLRISKFS